MVSVSAGTAPVPFFPCLFLKNDILVRTCCCQTHPSNGQDFVRRVLAPLLSARCAAGNRQGAVIAALAANGMAYAAQEVPHSALNTLRSRIQLSIVSCTSNSGKYLESIQHGLFESEMLDHDLAVALREDIHSREDWVRLLDLFSAVLLNQTQV